MHTISDQSYLEKKCWSKY